MQVAAPFLSVLARYKPLLWLLSAVGFFGLNGVFLYYALLRPDVVEAAMANPVAIVFMAEAFLLVGLGAWLVHVFGFRRPGWATFVILSIIGSLAFSLPFFLLLHIRKRVDPIGDGTDR